MKAFTYLFVLVLTFVLAVSASHKKKYSAIELGGTILDVGHPPRSIAVLGPRGVKDLFRKDGFRNEKD